MLMPMYLFVDEFGGQHERFYAMGDCPSFITLKDGTVAKRSFANAGFYFRGGSLPPGAEMRRKEQMTRRNLEAGKRGEEYWRSKNPRLGVE